MFKKIGTWIITGIMMITLLAGCGGDPAAKAGDNGTGNAGEVEKSSKIELALGEKTYDTAVDEEGNLYTADKDGIHIFDKEGVKKKDLVLEDGKPGALCVEGKTIYVFDTVKKEIVAMDPEGVVAWRKPTEDEIKVVFKMRKQGDGIYLLTDSGMNERALVKFDMAAGAARKLDVKGVWSFSGYKGAELLVVTRTNSTDNLQVLDTNSGQLKALAEFDTRVEGLEYDAAKGELFYTDMDNLFKSSLNKWKPVFATSLFVGEEAAVSAVGMIGTADGDESDFYYFMKGQSLMLSGSHAYTFKQTTGPMVRYSKAVNPEQKVLRILKSNGFPFNERQISLAFQEKYGNVPVVVSGIDEQNYYERLSVMLLSGDDSIDLFTLGADRTGDFFEKGIYTDLSSYPELKEKFGQMLPSVAGGCTREGKIVGAPAWMGIPVLSYMKQLAEAVKVPVKENYSWQELLGIFKKINGEAAAKAGNSEDDAGIQALSASWADLQKWMFSQYAVNHQDQKGGVTYNTPEFQAALDVLKELKTGKLFKEKETFLPTGNVSIAVKATTAGKSESGNVFDLSLLQSVMLKTEEQNMPAMMLGMGGDFIPLPGLEQDKAKRPFDLELLVIGPKSKNKELAAQFTALMLTPSTYITEDSQSGPSLNQVNKDAKSNKMVAIRIPMLEVSRIIYKDISLYKGLDQEWFDRFVAMMEGAAVSTGEQVFVESQEILEQFYNGSIDATAAASMIDSKAKKINE